MYSRKIEIRTVIIQMSDYEQKIKCFEIKSGIS